MCKSTNNTPSNLEAIRDLCVTIGEASHAGDTTPPPARYDGIREHIPEHTFVAAPVRNPDSFLTNAKNYHTFFGLSPQDVTSLDHILRLLSTSATPINRFRIVTHAHPENIMLSIVDGNQNHATQQYLDYFGESDITAIGYLIFFYDTMPPGVSLPHPTNRHYVDWSDSAVLTDLRTVAANQTVLQPFGLNTSGSASGDLKKFMFRCFDQSFVRITGAVKFNNHNLTATQKAKLVTAFSFILDSQQASLVGTTIAGNVITNVQLQNLRAMLDTLTLAELQAIGANYGFSLPAEYHYFDEIERAITALQNGFRTRLNAIKQRISTNTTIDIRGCRAGNDPSYLRSIQSFFGRTNNLPHVTGSQWYMAFHPSQYEEPTSLTEIRRLIATHGAFSNNIATTRSALSDWATKARVMPFHGTFWNDILRVSAGKVFDFCRLTWRTQFPRLPFPAPGLGALEAMTFRQVMEKIRDFFDVPAAGFPTASALTTLETFVNGPLAGYIPNLTAVANGSSTPTQLTNLFGLLRTINQDLAQSIVPSTPPTPLNSSHITGYQRDLIAFIETNRLSVVRTFMNAIKTRLEDQNNPGINCYMIHAGIPVFIFTFLERVNGATHTVTTNHNGLIVHHDHAVSAFTAWAAMQWEEEVPAGNGINAAAATEATRNSNVRVAMEVIEGHVSGNQAVAFCPHPNYWAHFTTV
jgi:hypothetical protein